MRLVWIMSPRSWVLSRKDRLMDFRLLRAKAKKRSTQSEGVSHSSSPIPSPGSQEKEKPQRIPDPPHLAPVPPPAIPTPVQRTDVRQRIESQREVSSSNQAKMEGAPLEYLWIRLAQEDYVIPLKEVEEVVRLFPITFVPRAPTWVRGIISLRGEMIPIVDLKKRMGFSCETPGQRIVVCFSGEDRCGFLVDEVKGVVRVGEESRQEIPPGIEEGKGKVFLKGLVRRNTMLFGELDLKKIISSDA